MALTDMERESNRNTPWETVTEDQAVPVTFGVRNPYTGEVLYSGLAHLWQAGQVISDLKVYGEVQPQHPTMG